MDGFAYSKLLESIERFGFTDPVTVRRRGSNLEIIDGEHRWRAARDVGLTGIDYFEVEVDDDEAQALTVILNELKGRHDPRELGQLLSGLLERNKPEQILVGMPFTTEALEGLVGLKNFDWTQFDGKPAVFDAPNENPSPRKGMRWVERTFRLPPDANEVLNDALAKAKENEDDMEDWQALELIAADFMGG